MSTHREPCLPTIDDAATHATARVRLAQNVQQCDVCATRGRKIARLPENSMIWLAATLDRHIRAHSYCAIRFLLPVWEGSWDPIVASASRSRDAICTFVSLLRLCFSLRASLQHSESAQRLTREAPAIGFPERSAVSLR